MDALASSLERSPELFPHAYDLRNDAVSLVRLTRADYEGASFLDERVLRPQTLSRTLPWGTLALAVESARLAERCDFIFHIGHVGSTLVSRLLGAHEAVFSLREPTILRTLAQMRNEPERLPRVWSGAEFEQRQSTFLKLWSRSFEPGQTPLIKATSFVSELAADLLARPAKPKAALLHVKPESYLATILGGPNARQEAKSLAVGRLKRLHARLGREAWHLGSLSEGEALAMSWAAEMSALAAAHAAAGERAFVLDFDSFLANPEEELAALFHHFDCPASSGIVSTILSGPLMQRYSKGPEHAYSPSLRREILDDARKTHAAEIAKGLAWLTRAADEFAVIRNCLELASA
jgi:hypothetical protein